MSERELLRLDGVPVYQNKMFGTEAEARACPRGDIVLAGSALEIDIHASKQGHSSPAAVSRTAAARGDFRRGDARIFVMNSSHLSEIRAMSRSGPNYIAVDQA